MTEDDLKAIEARANAATPGPWATGAGKVEGGQVRELVIAPNDDVIVAIAYGGFGNPVDRTTEDRQFIARARTDVPALVAEVRRAVGVIRAIIDASDGCQGHADCVHSMRPWSDARELLCQFDNDAEGLADVLRLRRTSNRMT